MYEFSLVEHLEKRPAMFGLDGSFREVSIFLEGVDVARDGTLFCGFREWLIVEVGGGNNLSWKALVLKLALPGRASYPGGARGLSPADDQVAVSALFDAIRRYRQMRETPNGLARIFASYLTWLRRQEWYKPGNPLYVE
jgi:hypothetical protein